MNNQTHRHCHHTGTPADMFGKRDLVAAFDFLPQDRRRSVIPPEEKSMTSTPLIFEDFREAHAPFGCPSRIVFNR
jgi:hypothetical protein